MKDTDSTWKNKLYFGDNLQILREHVPDESVDLIYLDPPFNSQATYNVLFGEKDGSKSQAQIAAFDDTWQWGQESEQTYQEIVFEGTRGLSDLIQAFRSFLGQSDMLAYLVMMAIRLSELHRVAKPTGSIYLHCDPTASHYLKLIMDSIFGPKNFRNEIIWCRSDPKAHTSRRFPSGHDVILFYSKTEETQFQMVYTSHDEKYLEAHYRHVDPKSGRRYDLTDLTNPNRNRPRLTYEFPPGSGTVKVWRWTRDRMLKAWEEGKVIVPKEGGVARFKRYLDEQKGTACHTVWDGIPPINSQAKERLGYPTQKPEALLERIVNASRKEGDVVLDPFCGCGTAISVAERLTRRWIGIDITHLAITLIRDRLYRAFTSKPSGISGKVEHLSPYEVIGAPTDNAGAKALANHDRYQFEWWALGLIPARPAQDKKKGADSGVDGYINFSDDNSGKVKRIVVQVKSGHVTASHIRDLKGVIDREQAVIGAFLTLEPPTRPMIQEALAAGYYVPEFLSKEHQAPKIQIITIEQLLSGLTLKYPRLAVSTFKEPERKHKGGGPKQEKLF